MSTRSLVCYGSNLPEAKAVYSHFDGDPKGVGATLLRLINTYGVDYVKWLVDEHTGWSQFGSNCYCHTRGDFTQPKNRATTTTDCGQEWLYLVTDEFVIVYKAYSQVLGDSMNYYTSNAVRLEDIPKLFQPFNLVPDNLRDTWKYFGLGEQNYLESIPSNYDPRDVYNYPSQLWEHAAEWLMYANYVTQKFLWGENRFKPQGVNNLLRCMDSGFLRFMQIYQHMRVVFDNENIFAALEAVEKKQNSIPSQTVDTFDRLNNALSLSGIEIGEE